MGNSVGAWLEFYSRSQRPRAAARAMLAMEGYHRALPQQPLLVLAQAVEEHQQQSDSWEGTADSTSSRQKSEATPSCQEDSPDSEPASSSTGEGGSPSPSPDSDFGVFL